MRFLPCNSYPQNKVVGTEFAFSWLIPTVLPSVRNVIVMAMEKQPYKEGRNCYFITFNTVDWVDVFIRPVYKQVIVHSLNHFIHQQQLPVYGWCLMTNHLHLVMQPGDHYDMATFEEEFKQFTTNKIMEAIDTEPDARRKWMMNLFREAGSFFSTTKKIQVWQRVTNPVFIETARPSQMVEHIEYVQQNPVRDRIVESAADYLYSSARDYAGLRGLVNITRLPVVEQQLAALENMNGRFSVKYIRN
ncbi:transposase [Nostoc ellipsosporum NOK]|nr:transposase [Nostoc ellipsosporum NOK]